MRKHRVKLTAVLILFGCLLVTGCDNNSSPGSTTTPAADPVDTTAATGTCSPGSLRSHADPWVWMGGRILKVEFTPLPGDKQRAVIYAHFGVNPSQQHRFNYVSRFISIAQNVFTDPGCSDVDELRLEAFAAFTTTYGGTADVSVIRATFPRSEADKVVNWQTFRTNMARDTRTFFSRIVSGAYIHPQVP